MAWDFNKEIISQILEEAGFDTSITEYVSAIKEEDDINHQCYLNPKGRIRYQFSRLLNKANQDIVVIGKKFSYEKENRDIVNVTGYLDSLDELVKFLQNITSLIKKGR